MQISIRQLVEKEFHASRVHSQMHLSERLINPAGMHGEGNLYAIFSVMPV